MITGIPITSTTNIYKLLDDTADDIEEQILNEVTDTYLKYKANKDMVEDILDNLPKTVTCKLCKETTNRQDWGDHLRDKEHLRRVQEWLNVRIDKNETYIQKEEDK